MLQFTQSQLDALDEISRQNFVEKVALDLQKSELVTTELSHDELINRVKSTISCAKGFGLTNRYSLTMFAKLSFIFGPRFYKHPLINHTLQDETVKSHHRIDAIMEKMDDRWDDVEEIDDWDFYCQEFVTNG